MSYDTKVNSIVPTILTIFMKIGGFCMSTDQLKQSSISLEENLKKALTEILILNLLSQKDYFIGEISEVLNQKSNGVLKLVFPYSAVYRLKEDGFVSDGEKRVASDGRKRQFYSITPLGREHYKHLLVTYRQFITGVNMILDEET